MALDVTSLYNDVVHNGMRWGPSLFISLQGFIEELVENAVPSDAETIEDARAPLRRRKSNF
jgi:hypothetical protein